MFGIKHALAQSPVARCKNTMIVISHFTGTGKLDFAEVKHKYPKKREKNRITPARLPGFIFPAPNEQDDQGTPGNRNERGKARQK